MQASMGLESVCGVIGTKGQAFAGAIPHSLGRYSHICCKALLPTGERETDVAVVLTANESDGLVASVT